MFPNNDSQLTQLRRIGRYAFCGFKSLQGIAIPDSVTTFGEGAFAECTNLDSVLFTDQSCLQEIEVGAFMDCNSLQSILIPKSVTTIGESAFEECSCMAPLHILCANPAVTKTNDQAAVSQEH